jgi:streptogrisin C
MDRRRVITTAAVVATVGAAAALTLPSFADTQSHSPGPAATSAVSPKLLDAMQRDLKLTEGQARGRLAREASAMKAAKDLRKQMRDSWAGAWMGADGQMTVATTDPADAEKITRAGAKAKLVRRNSDQLKAAKSSLDARARSAGSGITGWYVDPASNQVVVMTSSTDPSRVASFVESAGVPTDAVRVQSVKGRPRLLADPSPGPVDGQVPPGHQTGRPGVRTGQQQGDQQQGGQQQGGQGDGQDAGQSAPPAGGDQQQAGNGQAVRGGDAYVINGDARCTVGFAVQGGFLSAGHCGQPGDTTEALNNGTPTAEGVFAASRFPGDDFSFVRTNADFTPTGEVQSFDGQAQPVASDQVLPVAGSTEAPVGATVCKFGSTTGATCGTIQQLDATVNFADPSGSGGLVTVSGLIGTDVCAEAGDSGGPLLAAGNQAQGTVSGGSGDCANGGSTFFQPVNEALQALNLTLLTTAGQ